MRARQATRRVVFPLIILLNVPSFGQAPPSKKAQDTASPNPSTAAPPLAAIPPATQAEAKRVQLSADVRLKELGPAEKDSPVGKAIREVLDARLKVLADWVAASKEREAAEHPEPSPERELAEGRAELEKVKTLLDQSAKAPDALLPGAFQEAAGGKATEARLAGMKEAIDAARFELKERSDEVEKLRAEGTRSIASEIATLRAGRDKAYQTCAAQAARRGEREAAIRSAATPEGRDLARERLVNDDWEYRLESARLATLDAKIVVETRRIDVVSARLQLKAMRVQLDKRLIARMEDRYAAVAERQRSEIEQAVAREQRRAERENDPLERYRAKRTAELLQLEAQVIAYEKAGATTAGLSIADATSLADHASDDFAQLEKLLSDGNVSPLDVLRLKNDFRRIVPERAQVIRTDLAASNEELTAYENALTDAEIDLVNDSRDDRFEREAFLEQLPRGRRAEAKAMLEELELRHRTLLIRRRDVLAKLSRRAEDVHNQVLRRLDTLDKHYAFIRTHIFWIRDAEPVGPATFAHARDDAIRAAKALVKLGLEPWDRSLWGKVSLEFILVAAILAILPLPLHLGQRALDRHRLAGGDGAGLTLDDLR